jgi:hypothetical protein
VRHEEKKRVEKNVQDNPMYVQSLVSVVERVRVNVAYVVVIRTGAYVEENVVVAAVVVEVDVTMQNDNVVVEMYSFHHHYVLSYIQVVAMHHYYYYYYHHYYHSYIVHVVVPQPNVQVNT